MNHDKLKAIVQEAAKTIKTEADLNEFRQMLTKIMVETALNAESDNHLGYSKHKVSDSSNSRNGFMGKTLQTDDGQFEIDTPRDRNGSFEPQLVKKRQRSFTSMDDKILFVYAQGMTTREIVATFKEMYGADVSAILISKLNGVTAPLINYVLLTGSDLWVTPFFQRQSSITPYTLKNSRLVEFCRFDDIRRQIMR